jgi:pimeloyl-ACP methyl ester carboxylesterase
MPRHATGSAASDADLSLRGMGRLLADFIAALDLQRVTLGFNDWCGAQVMIADGLMHRVERLVLVSCEAFDNYPPGLPGWMAARTAELPGAGAVMAHGLRVRRLRRLPIALGCLSKRGVPDDVVDARLRPLRRREIRRDFRKHAADTRRGRRDLIAATEALSSFVRPVLIVWAAEDRVMPPAHGRRLAELFPNSRLIEVPDSYTLIPEDQPALLAAHLRTFISETAPAATERIDER